MKLKYERFEGLSCLYVRGTVDENLSRLLTVGLDTILKDLEETLLVNLVHAKLDPAPLMGLVEYKKKITTEGPHKIYWITKDKGITDFPSIEVFISRMPGAKGRQIGERIREDDETYALTQAIKTLQESIAQKGGNDDNVSKLILENSILKEQKRILDATIKFQIARDKMQALKPSADTEIKTKLDEAYELVKKLHGKEIDL